ncbi:MAG: ABC transporter substrate-binding protein [Gemmatimonadales bacterium]
MKLHPAGVIILILGAVLLAWTCHSPPKVGLIGYAQEEGFTNVVPLAAELIGEDSGMAERVGFHVAELRSDSATAKDVRIALDVTTLHGLSAVLGPGSSRGMLAAAPIYDDARIPVITPTATSRLVQRVGAWTFMLAPNDSVEGAYLAQVAAERFHARTVTIFHVNDEYGTGLRDAILADLEHRGIPVLDVRPLPDTPGWCTSQGPTAAFAGVVQASLRHGIADVVIAATRDLGTGCLAKQLDQSGALRRILAGDGTLMNGDLFDQAGGAADSVYAAAFWHPARADPVSQRFVTRYTARFGSVPNHGEAMRFDAVMILAEAIREAGPVPDAVRAWLSELGRSRPAYHGVTGALAFGAARTTSFTLIRADRTTRLSLLVP